MTIKCGKKIKKESWTNLVLKNFWMYAKYEISISKANTLKKSTIFIENKAGIIEISAYNKLVRGLVFEEQSGL